MSDPETAAEIPEFELPEWGTEGAPPHPPFPDDPGADTEVAGETREIAIEVEYDVTVTTTSLPQGWRITEVLGLVTGEASSDKDDPAKAAAKAKGKAVETATEAARALGANAITGLRLEMTSAKGAIAVIAYGTAVRFDRG